MIKQGKLNEAKSYYQEAMAIRPQYPEAISNLALIYANQKKYDKTRSLFQQAIEFWPDNAELYYNVACMYAQQNEINQANHWLKMALNKGYDNWNAIKTDSDLENIRNSTDYQNLIKNR